jgi:hypothetical protein
VGSIHRARVVSVRPFGAFVELPGYRKQALVHHTQVRSATDLSHCLRRELGMLHWVFSFCRLLQQPVICATTGRRLHGLRVGTSASQPPAPASAASSS